MFQFDLQRYEKNLANELISKLANEFIKLMVFNVLIIIMGSFAFRAQGECFAGESHATRSRGVFNVLMCQLN